MSETVRNPLAQKFTCISLLQFAVPSILMMVFMGLYTIIDTIFVSRLVNTDALSAMNIVCPIINLTVGLSALLATGGNAIISRKMGAGAESEARENFTFLIFSGIILGIVITLLGLLFLHQLVIGLGASDRLLPYGEDYLGVLLLFTPFAILQVLFQNLFVTAGKPCLGLWLSIVAGCTNAILDYLFIAVFHMGIAGAALGTGIGYTLPAIVGCIFFWKSKGTLYFTRIVIDLGVLKECCINGSSEMVSQLAAAVTTFLFNAAMMRLVGEPGVAAITILIYSQFLLSSLYFGFSMGVAPVLGYQYGRKDHQQLKKVFHICIRVIACTSFLIFLLSYCKGEFIASIFAKDDQDVYSLAKQGFQIFSFSFLFSGVNIFTSAMFTALSNGKVSAVLSFMRTLVFITLALLVFPYLWGIQGVWLSIPFAEAAAAVLSLITVFAYRAVDSYT